VQFIKGLPALFSHPDLEDIESGNGNVIKIENDSVAAYRDDKGKLHIVSAICPHLGCVVHFNKAEKSWDCPCHGSRFTTEGDVIEGPAYKGLERKE
jgi:Rieske Fe-S protein